MNEYKSMTLAQLADLCGVTPDTMRRWIRAELPELANRRRGLFKPKEVKVVVENFL
jgi:hypothetical protein